MLVRKNARNMQYCNITGGRMWQSYILLSSKVLTLDNENKKTFSFVLHCAR